MEKPGVIFLKAGDKVRVNLTVKAFRQLQDNALYGGWQNDMDQVCVDFTHSFSPNITYL